MNDKKNIALVAHDGRKEDLLDWTQHNVKALSQHRIFATGTTGRIISEQCGLKVNCLKSGPLGGDQQLGTMVANEELDVVIFFWDPMTAQPHDVDVKALLRMTVVYNVPVACNRSTADFLITSELFHAPYEPAKKDYEKYIKRET